MSRTQSTTEYFFDWRSEAKNDGWDLADGIWRHQEGRVEHADHSFVYLGSECWIEAWPAGEGPGAREPDRSAHRRRDAAW